MGLYGRGAAVPRNSARLLAREWYVVDWFTVGKLGGPTGGAQCHRHFGCSNEFPISCTPLHATFKSQNAVRLRSSLPAALYSVTDTAIFMSLQAVLIPAACSTFNAPAQARALQQWV